MSKILKINIKDEQNHQCENSSICYSVCYSANTMGSGQLYFSSGTKVMVEAGKMNILRFHFKKSFFVILV